MSRWRIWQCTAWSFPRRCSRRSARLPRNMVLTSGVGGTQPHGWGGAPAHPPRATLACRWMWSPVAWLTTLPTARVTAGPTRAAEECRQVRNRAARWSRSEGGADVVLRYLPDLGADCRRRRLLIRKGPGQGTDRGLHRWGE